MDAFTELQCVAGDKQLLLLVLPLSSPVLLVLSVLLLLPACGSFRTASKQRFHLRRHLSKDLVRVAVDRSQPVRTSSESGTLARM